MSFLPFDDLDPTLTDVLAFIDDFTSSESDHSSSVPSSSTTPLSSSDPLYCRKKSRAAASRRFQQKKKAELRDQATTLQKRLQELQDNKTTGNNKTLDEIQKREIGAAWLSKVELEKQLRLVAEAQNRHLKTLLLRQKHTANAVRHVLQNVTAAVHVEEGLRTPHPAASRFSRFVPSLDDAIYSELASRVGSLYLDAVLTTDFLQAKFIPDEVEIRWYPVSGVPYVEVKMSLPLRLSFQDTANIAQQARALDEKRYVSVIPMSHDVDNTTLFVLQNLGSVMRQNFMDMSKIYLDG
ncbi:hypothetical protein JG688_00013214 [Phytophthora aleatoria]|uniref:Uncharacterized protein n=1 Tax=Phytophthora aleatoria TaxID=2496075 RepID=A0A8J5IME6_9STRA|nr:hypothetical protein JG688_00013214 [Phytophthora aleatoria]